MHYLTANNPIFLNMKEIAHIVFHSSLPWGSIYRIFTCNFHKIIPLQFLFALIFRKSLMAIESQWVTFKTGEETFGIEIQYVQEMLRMPQVHSIPKMPYDNLGVVVLRSEVIPVFDLRAKFGLQSSSAHSEEVIGMLKQRQQDHENWLNELRQCIEENRDFTLTTDPHACAFGKWYDHFESDNPDFNKQIRKFNEPHKKIHAAGEEIINFQKNGEHHRALEVFQNLRSNVFESMIKVFTETYAFVEDMSRPSLIVVGSTSCRLAIAVDEICSAVRCMDDDIQAPDSIPGSEQFSGLIGLLADKSSHKLIMLLDPAELFPQLCGI
jgi:chemotaxis signal transduction protein